ncbi:LytTR family DNA-binding domain-containing protein [soil metagenome]
MLRTLIVDDEAPARQRLGRLLKSYDKAGRLKVVAEAEDGDAALKLIREHTPDLVFLDIQMPGLDGFAVLDRLGSEFSPAVIFTTAYDQYALRAFDAAAVDYVLKPIDEDRLAAAIGRAERMTSRKAEPGGTQERLAELLEFLDSKPPPVSQGPYLKQISVPARNRLVVVPVDQIAAAEVQDGITRILTISDNGEVGRYAVSTPLDTLEARLDPADFLRVHRSALIRLGHIREMIPWFSGRYKLVLAGGHEVIASRARSREVRDLLSL